ncbi:MAG: adenylate/guanylate cyclase domain-containing protein [Archangium sp.]|nr:adenylate/guanylate cyclase domain-containing protein [Archangium sp.]MDP3155851.1 adenylate/guanylate cyclase domain-containing protein [Archangium sp.]MDP3575439.1 adenylate/guanylate cyclase domain-containing protein [Archangium sp.]
MDAELTFEELKLLRLVSRTVDDLLEESLKARESLQQTFKRLFPPMLAVIGGKGAVVSTLDEELAQATFHHGDFGGVFAGTYLEAARWGVRKLESGDTLCSQALDLVGHQVGSIGVLFAGDRTADAARLGRLLDAIAEQLDTVLASVQTASEKHQVLVTINHSLSNRVFETGMDGAVRALCERVKVPGFLLMYRDAVESGALHYRSYKYGQLEYSSNGRRDAELDAAIRAYGQNLIMPHDRQLQAVLGNRKAVETVLISGVAESHALGKIMVWSNGEGFSSYTMELLRLLGSTLSQRLIDYNRERIHLSQFFSGRAIDELLRDPDYERSYLAPRAEEVGIIFADINGFTRICEQVLERPERIGKFVDDWSEEAVRILHRHGGVFDKMVGDCVIGLFGPPFFKDDAASRAGATLKAAIEIQRFTKDTMSAHPEISRLSEILQVPGLGVAIGVNLTPSFCGLFGPNRNYTSFSTGMNQTARLQSLGAFRETLVMDSAMKAIATSKDPSLAGLKFGPLVETPVKNVAQPLRYYKLLE